AQAHLRRALLSLAVDARTREHARNAMKLRASLDLHDRALLDAFWPWTDLPQDGVEAERRFARLVLSKPDDADYQYFLCRVRYFIGEYERSNDACAAAIRIDPTFAAP